MNNYTRKALSAALFFALSTGVAMAHAHLKDASPADKASVASPAQLDLDFSEAVNLKFSKVTVTGPAKAAVKLGDPMLMNEDRQLMIPVPEKLAPGEYTVDWHVLSTDGHKSKGKYSFTVKP